MLNGAIYIRRELLIRLVRAFDDGTLREELDRIMDKKLAEIKALLEV